MSICIGIDASRARSGGAITHLLNLVENFNINKTSISIVHLWLDHKLFESMPSREGIVKHLVITSKYCLPVQLFWQWAILPLRAKEKKIDLMFNVDSGTLCGFSPSVTLNQDILSFANDEITRMHKLSFGYFRVRILRYVHKYSLKHSSATIFLTNFSKNLVSGSCNVNNPYVVPHGISRDYFWICKKKVQIRGEIECIYVSNILSYKNQFTVVRAIKILRELVGINIKIKFVGGGHGWYYNKTVNLINAIDPSGDFLSIYDFVPPNVVKDLVSEADVFIYASSCEAFGITLLEGMASGLPVICSSLSSLPETAADSVRYFDPHSASSLVIALLHHINNPNESSILQKKSIEIASRYSLERTANMTWKILADTARNNL